jgi:DNA-binding GntR family transcriptional regulator
VAREHRRRLPECSRRTVIRATQKLAAEGRIDSFLERRPGCK